ncbi:hypothetical protein HFO42_31735 [Rhizobium leguminosarum]|uniref:Uncharacterized protein n=1 Tax=Rhizobium leguminosarum TaxID=384 RepID=A0AAJ1EHM5_RHILE|nr:hypothetical protein [Rhizobium laguerreae]MBY5537089.1 hypothetical protein [Rhizobium leguminosarum]MBY3190332.1 hypothetical protein [Rhizobium laguerreae]MBY3198708.1 hypothetical protein [Rhizobium laguerreae]MBY3232099.1 hypothetical protein [Rhizobium laguerreae]
MVAGRKDDPRQFVQVSISLGNARCIGESALILFFIYNKHFQVNGNIDPVDEGGNEPQATGNKLKVV